MTGIHPMVLMKVHSFRLHKFLSVNHCFLPRHLISALVREEWGVVAKESGEQARKISHRRERRKKANLKTLERRSSIL